MEKQKHRGGGHLFLHAVIHVRTPYMYSTLPVAQLPGEDGSSCFLPPRRRKEMDVHVLYIRADMKRSTAQAQGLINASERFLFVHVLWRLRVEWEVYGEKKGGS